jgi:hypothetical protein
MPGEDTLLLNGLYRHKAHIRPRARCMKLETIAPLRDNPLVGLPPVAA